jgi:hypothetical protein
MLAVEAAAAAAAIAATTEGQIRSQACLHFNKLRCLDSGLA